MLKKIYSFIELSKPKILSLVLLSGLVAIFLEKSLIKEWVDIILLILALSLIGSSANALNQIFEIDIDSKMQRTKYKRPLVTKDLKLSEAVIFSISSGILGIFILFYFYNFYSAFIAFFTIFFYSVVYTLLLKPYTVQGIVIGGIGGATAPLIIWAATRNSLLNLEVWVLFLLIFFWTPPHFWALSLFCKEDYVKAGLPMLPIVKGSEETIRQIFIYSVLLFIVSLLLLLTGVYILYTIASIFLGIRFIFQAYYLKSDNAEKQYQFFINSIIYLYVLFFALILDVMLGFYIIF